MDTIQTALAAYLARARKGSAAVASEEQGGTHPHEQSRATAAERMAAYLTERSGARGPGPRWRDVTIKGP